jgi:putative ABC transport system permease protein
VTPRHLLNGLRALTRRRHEDADLADEIRAYLEADIQAKVSAGMTPLKAERAARTAMGSRAAVGDSVHDVGWEIRFEHAWRDVRRGLHAARIRGWRGVFVVLLLGISLAANTVVFSAADSFVLRPVPYPDANRLVQIGEISPFSGWSPWIAPESVRAWRSTRELFSSIYGYQSNLGRADFAFLPLASVEPGLLETVGARPIAGRLLMPDDAKAGAPPVVVLAEELARQKFGTPELAVGQSLKVDKSLAVVVGVLPVSFRFPSGNERIWAPLDISSLPPNRFVANVGLMAPGLSAADAAAGVKARTAAVTSQLSPPFNGFTRDLQVRAFGPAATGSLRQLFLLLCAAAGALLLVACANVVNLELASAVATRRRQAIALALGASPASLLRAALVEGAVSLIAAMGLAVSLSYAAIGWLVAHLPDKATKALVNPLNADVRALWFMGGIAVGVWLLTSLPPALAAANTSVLDALRVESRSFAGSRRSRCVRHWLTVGEMAVTVIVLIGGSLAVRTYNSLLIIPKGFDTTGLVAVDVRLPPGSSVLPRDLNEQLLEQFRMRPDVVAVSMTGANPPATAGGAGGTLTIEGRSGDFGRVQFGPYDADADFFTKTMRLPIRDGRDFRPDDPPNAVIVDELFAKRFWPDGHSVGARFRIGAGWPEVMENGYLIVGVAAHLRSSRDALTSPSDEFFPIYRHPPSLNTFSNLAYAVRLSDASHIDEVRAMVRALAPGAVVRVDAVEARYAEAFANQLMAASIMSAFGGASFLIAIAGLYSVMAFLVAARSREIGVRMAVGASRVDITRLVLTSAARLVGSGVAIGVFAALIVSRLASSLLFGVAPTDPTTYVGVVAAVVMTGLVATWLPVRRAAQIDPVVALRVE